MAGVHLIPVPTAFAVGDVNCYLVEDDPLTLVDTGVDSVTALTALEAGLAERGRKLADLERIILTHQHLDHVGLAQHLVDRSGAELWAFGPLAPWLRDYDEGMEANDRYAEAEMRRHGVPGDVVTALRSLTRLTRAWGRAAEITHGLAGGDTVPFAGRTWQVLHRPGHSPSDLLFFDERSGELLSGDHLLRHISSNALMTLPLDGSPADRHPHPLLTYLASLRETRETEAGLVFPGHGETFTGHRELIDSRLQGTERRAEKIGRLLDDEPLTVHEMAQRLWGSVAFTQAWLTTSELLGHLAILEGRGEVVEREDDDVVRFGRA